MGSEWLFTPELKSGTVVSVLDDWSLAPVNLWEVFASGRGASVKALAFVVFIEQAISE
jgi:hypothetical protein